MRLLRVSSVYLNVKELIEQDTAHARKRVLISSTISKCSITENDAMVTLAISVR